MAAQREDQRHVDRATLGHHVLDRREAGSRRGDLDHQVRPLDRFVQAHRLTEGPERVVGEPGLDLDGDVPVARGAAIPDRAEDVAGVHDVLLGQRPERLRDAPALRREVVELFVVGAARGHRLLEDRRVRGGADDGEVVDQFLEMPAPDHVAREEVQPHALP